VDNEDRLLRKSIKLIFGNSKIIESWQSHDVRALLVLLVARSARSAVQSTVREAKKARAALRTVREAKKARAALRTVCEAKKARASLREDCPRSEKGQGLASRGPSAERKRPGPLRGMCACAFQIVNILFDLRVFSTVKIKN
jgi:hypothetical protein